jgi:nucleoprotein TPR
MRTKLEGEMKELRDRLGDSKQQNSLLHSQLETVSAQALKIRERMEPSTSTDEVAAEGEDLPSFNERQKELENLNGLISFLRREKDIADAQMELLKSQHSRLSSQNSQLQRSLDESRSILDEERKQSQESLGSEKKHAELMEKINQINILRESNANLRSEHNHGKAQIIRLQTDLNAKENELVPLKCTLFSL